MAKINVQYNAPKVNASFPGSPHRITSAKLSIYPGMTEAISIRIGNMDGVPINLVGFRAKIVFWKVNRRDTYDMTMGQSNVVFEKMIDIIDPHTGECEVVLKSSDTIMLGRTNRTSLSWGIFLINDEGDVFPMELQPNGTKYSTAHINLESGMPIAEHIA